jgi:hypothetical protein
MLRRGVECSIYGVLKTGPSGPLVILIRIAWWRWLLFSGFFHA